MSAVRAVVFDLGGVLTPSVASTVDRYGAEVGLPPAFLSAFFRGDGDFAQVEVGAMTSREFLKRVCVRTEQETGIRLDIRRLAASAEAAGVPDPEMVRLVADVRRCVATGLLTNNVREATGWREALDLSLFDVVVDSSDVGMRKPDPAIYRLVVSKLGCPADSVVFVDDFSENLPAAAALGLTTLLFADPASCRRDLAALGVLGAASASSPLVGRSATTDRP